MHFLKASVSRWAKVACNHLIGTYKHSNEDTRKGVFAQLFRGTQDMQESSTHLFARSVGKIHWNLALNVLG